MKTGLALLFLAQIGFSFGFFPELNFELPVEFQQDSLQYRNVLENVMEEQRYGCGQPMGEAENEGMKLIVRLKRMAACSQGIPRV